MFSVAIARPLQFSGLRVFYILLHDIKTKLRLNVNKVNSNLFEPRERNESKNFLFCTPSFRQLILTFFDFMSQTWQFSYVHGRMRKWARERERESDRDKAGLVARVHFGLFIFSFGSFCSLPLSHLLFYFRLHFFRLAVHKVFCFFSRFHSLTVKLSFTPESLGSELELQQNFIL